MAGYRYKISLKVWHPSKSLEDVTARLGISPQRVWKRGEPRMLSTPGILPDRHDDNYWVARIMEGAYAENDLSSAIDSVLDKLLPSREFLIDRASDGGKLQLSIGWFFDEGNSGAVLGHSLFKRLSDFKIDLSFDVYPTHHAD